MPWWVWLLVLWLVLAVPVAVLLGRMLRASGERETDIDPPGLIAPVDLRSVDRQLGECRMGPVPLPRRLPSRPGARSRRHRPRLPR